ncbi:thiosulfate reductase cytochrome B subunit [Escherichia albertii]|uniref:thiosulfate reductase cytochrome B subunit n=1 Tax=Escherichia albertii TaxID=208962 RepID=UPI00235EA5CD|nr:thiosulfate reductase cytochrome B subunit [Escherichia albertii]WDB50884.1 thiosulfate reductase cytochrome B subunit [Escherichia albertii]
MRGLFKRGLFYLVLGLSPVAGQAAAVATEQLNQPCQACHADSDIQGISTNKTQVDLFVAPDSFQESVHGGVPCIACHQSKPESEGFAVTPHQLAPVDVNRCESCHGVAMHDTVHAVQQSVHKEKISQGLFTCTSCHNAHTMQKGEINHPSGQQIADDNLQCTSCHSRAGVYSQLSGGKASKDQDMAHSTLPYAPQHMSALRCIDCHADVKDPTMHRILSADKSVSCEQCHGNSSLLAMRLKNTTPDEDVSAGSLLGKGIFDDQAIREKLAKVSVPPPPVRQVNGALFTDSYMIGNNGSGRMDHYFAYGICGLVVLLLSHGLGRIATRRCMAGIAIEKHYIYTLPVRCWHWLNALAFALLIVSGFALHWVHSSFSLWVDIHNTAGIALGFIWLGFLAVALCGNGHHYCVRWQGITDRVIRQTRFYLYGIFRGDPHPEHATEAAKFNVLQQIGYITVMFLCLPLLLVTGLLMMYPAYTPEYIFSLPGKQIVAYLHYALAVVMVAFIAVHLYLCSTGDTPGALLKGMLDGFHRIRKPK